jgi:hypothetical protein
MPARMKRTQVLFPEDQYRRLKQMAEERQCSLSLLVREAVAQAYMRRPGKARQKAARRLVRMSLPVADWSELEEEIARGKDDA